MKLVGFPGNADPNTVYKEVYDLLNEESERRNFTEFICESYPGHSSYDANSYLPVAEIVKSIHSSILKLEEKNEFYMVLCRSFGCVPFIEFLKFYPQIPNPQIYFPKRIRGEGHKITKVNKDYFDLIFK